MMYTYLIIFTNMPEKVPCSSDVQFNLETELAALDPLIEADRISDVFKAIDTSGHREEFAEAAAIKVLEWNSYEMYLQIGRQYHLSPQILRIRAVGLACLERRFGRDFDFRVAQDMCAHFGFSREEVRYRVLPSIVCCVTRSGLEFDRYLISGITCFGLTWEDYQIPEIQDHAQKSLPDELKYGSDTEKLDRFLYFIPPEKAKEIARDVLMWVYVESVSLARTDEIVHRIMSKIRFHDSELGKIIFNATRYCYFQKNMERFQSICRSQSWNPDEIIDRIKGTH